MSAAATLAVLVAALSDRLVAELPTAVHPVAWFGRLVAPFDRDWDPGRGTYRADGATAAPGPRSRLVGVAVAVALPLLAAAAVWGAVRTAGAVGAAVVGSAPVDGLGPASAFEAVAAGVALFTATSRRMLTQVAGEVLRATESNLERARATLRALAGRDADSLSAGEVRSAAVESAAENLTDGLVAPLLGFVLLAPVSLPLGAAAAAWVKAVNTLDSMLGYPSKPVGGPSARLDDAVMWLPARLSAALLALSAADPGAVVRARELAGRPVSPNSGWPMATLAAALGVRLEKPGQYVLDAGSALPAPPEAERGVAVVARAGLLAFALAGVVAWP